MKNRNKFISGVVIFVITTAIFSDWEDFKAGLLGKPPVEQIETRVN